MKAEYFTNKYTHQTIKIPKGFSWTMGFFGWFVPLLRNDFKAAFLSVLCWFIALCYPLYSITSVGRQETDPILFPLVVLVFAALMTAPLTVLLGIAWTAFTAIVTGGPFDPKIILIIFIGISLFWCQFYNQYSANRLRYSGDWFDSSSVFDV